jgi:simple sugar transport system substrate-binding protein
VFAQSPASPPPPFDAPPVRIAVVRQTSDGEDVEDWLDGAEDQAEALDIDLLVSSAEGDEAASAEDLQAAIAQAPAAIIIDHGTAEALAPGIAAAVEAGIPVIAYGMDADPDAGAGDPAVVRIEQSDADIARLALEQLVADTGGQGDIGYVYVAGIAPLDRRDAVFQKVLAVNPGLRNAATFGKVSASTAADVETQTAAVLILDPNLTAIFAPDDEFATGAAAAVEAAGLADQVKVYGAGISTADIDVITTEGSPWVATAGTDPANLGRVAVRAAALAAAGEELPVSIAVPPTLVTQRFLVDDGITTIAQLRDALPTLDTSDILPISWAPATD